MDFFESYFDYAGVTKSEAPAIFHRWTAISIISALLGRNCYLPFGHSKIYPNQYIMMMGSPGTRKSSAINIGTHLLKETGYNRFSSSKTSKERFLMDMRTTDTKGDIEDLLDLTTEEPAESFIAIGEFTDFIGQNNMEFVTMLTNLWDCPPDYTNPKIHGKSVVVNKPVVNILGGNTASGFALAFPPEALGNGFLSRLIFVSGEPTGKLVTFPEAPDELMEQMLVVHLQEIKQMCRGAFTIGKDAKAMFERLYKEAVLIEDYRFKHYATRRFTHLLKLSLIVAASNLRMDITVEDALKANTILYFTERKMPKALGEFGKSKYSDVSNTVLEVLHGAKKPMNANDIFRKVSQDIAKMSELLEVMKNLQHANKVQIITMLGKTGYMPFMEQSKEWHKDLILTDYLTMDERM